MADRPASGDSASLTPTAIRMIWALYTLERRNGHEWVHVAELAAQLELAPEAVHRILMQFRPRRALRRSTEHPRKWRIGEQGRSVCRTIESIARAWHAESRDG